jgi:lipopolysaccharide transport system permease protein
MLTDTLPTTGMPTGLAEVKLPPAPPKPDKLILRATPGWRAVNLRELWRYRELLWFLALRDIQVRYKQTALGAAWAVIQPVFTMLLFSIFFGYLGGMGNRIEGNIPYPLYTYCALLPWQLFAYALLQGSISVVASRGLITKVYFPRLIVPIAPLLCGLLDFAISAVIFGLMMVWYGVAPGWPVLALPLFLILALATSLAVSLWLSALNAMYRDVQYTLPFLTQVWLFATPVAYPASLVPEKWRWVLGLNPMAGVVDGFRWCLLDSADAPGPMLLVSIASVTVFLIGGLFFYSRMEKTFTDVV